MAKYWMIWLAIKFINNLGFCINLFCVYIYKDVENVRFFKKQLMKIKRIWRLPYRVKKKEGESEKEKIINYRNLYRLLYIRMGVVPMYNMRGGICTVGDKHDACSINIPCWGRSYPRDDRGDQNFYI